MDDLEKEHYRPIPRDLSDGQQKARANYGSRMLTARRIILEKFPPGTLFNLPADMKVYDDVPTSELHRFAGREVELDKVQLQGKVFFVMLNLQPIHPESKKKIISFGAIRFLKLFGLTHLLDEQ